MIAPYYQRDGVTLYHDDCREVLSSVSRCSLLLTDPPYGVSYRSNGRKTLAPYESIIGDDTTAMAIEGVSAAFDRLHHGRHLYVFGPPEIVSGLKIKRVIELVWNKERMSIGDLSVPWGNQHERISFAVKLPFGRVVGYAKPLRRGSVLTIPRVDGNHSTHPTEKPVRLLRELIEVSSKFGEVVLDPFCGTGATLVASMREGRRAIGIEIEERYCEIAAKRLEQEVLPLEVSA